MSGKHTPSPWIALGCNLWGARSQLVARWGTFRFSDGSKAQPVAPTEADAQLIAAAPELLEAAKWILRSAGYENGEALPTLRELTVGIPHLDRLRTVISKAEKEGD